MSAGRDILVVDDQPANVVLLTQLLVERGFRVRAVTSGARALEAAVAAPPDCILLDVSMPGMDGFQACVALHAEPTLKDVPIIFLTAHDDVEHKVRGFQVGGSDYITKPFQTDEVVTRVRHQLRVVDLERTLRSHNLALEDANARLQEASSLKARLTAMLVHDIKSPLSVIGLLVDTAMTAEDIELVRAAHATMATLLENMLELSRAEQGELKRQPKVVDLSAVVERATQMASRVAVANQVALRVVTTPGIQISGDATQIERVFANLLDNALKFTPRDGTVSVSLHEEQGEGVETGLRFAAARIRDTGPGIAPEELPFVFDAYFQASPGRARGGFGLGLAIVARIVAEHRGRIRVQSRVGVGTEFVVLLPLEG